MLNKLNHLIKNLLTQIMVVYYSEISKNIFQLLKFTDPVEADKDMEKSVKETKELIDGYVEALENSIESADDFVEESKRLEYVQFCEYLKADRENLRDGYNKAADKDVARAREIKSQIRGLWAYILFILDGFDDSKPFAVADREYELCKPRIQQCLDLVREYNEIKACAKYDSETTEQIVVDDYQRTWTDLEKYYEN